MTTVKSDDMTKIEGGSVSQRKEWPWMINIRHGDLGRVLCGGFLVTDRSIITAAHCIEKK